MTGALAEIGAVFKTAFSYGTKPANSLQHFSIKR
jgi:hypothetical protein